MSVAIAKWATHECWSAEGVILPTDEFIPLHGSCETGYRAGPPEPLARAAGGWVEVDTQCQFESHALIVEAGAGPVEAEGFVAVTDAVSGRLVWILHLSDSEAFTAVTVEDGEVVAVAEEYPFRNVFRIPIGEPQMLRVESRRQAELGAADGGV